MAQTAPAARITRGAALGGNAAVRRGVNARSNRLECKVMHILTLFNVYVCVILDY